jgi:hypothetical protein
MESFAIKDLAEKPLFITLQESGILKEIDFAVEQV